MRPALPLSSQVNILQVVEGGVTMNVLRVFFMYQ